MMGILSLTLIELSCTFTPKVAGRGENFALRTFLQDCLEGEVEEPWGRGGRRGE